MIWISSEGSGIYFTLGEEEWMRLVHYCAWGADGEECITLNSTSAYLFTCFFLKLVLYEFLVPNDLFKNCPGARFINYLNKCHRFS